MYKKLVFCFEIGTVDGVAIVDFFKAFVKFKPVRFTRGTRMKDWNEKRDIKAILSDSEDTRFFIEDDQMNYFVVSTIGNSLKTKCIKINSEISTQNMSDEIIYPFLQREGFIAAYLLNADYENVQSTKNASNYEGLGYSKEILDSVSETPCENGMWGKEYNILFNPGRSILLENLWLMVGWKMWFGEGFFHLIPKNKILSFPNAIECKELGNDIAYVRLFDKLEAPNTPDAVLRQWQWREWTDYNGLEKKYG